MKPIAISIHHEAGNAGFAGVNNWHRKKWNVYKTGVLKGQYMSDVDARLFGTLSTLGFYIGYQWYFDKAKGWIQGRAEDEEGAHTLDGWNKKAVGLCLQGYYGQETLDEETKKELWTKIEEIRNRWDIPQDMIKGHKELQLSKPTVCPASLMFFVQSYRNTKLKNVEELKLKVKLLTRILKLIKQLAKLKNLLRRK